MWSKRAPSSRRVSWPSSGSIGEPPLLHYARAARLQPSNRQYAQAAGRLARKTWATTAQRPDTDEWRLNLATAKFGPDASETKARALNNLALAYQKLAVYAKTAAALSAGWRSVRRRWARTIRPSRSGTTISPHCFRTRAAWRGRAAVPAGVAIREKALGKDHPTVATAQQSRLVASGPGQACRGRAALSADDRDLREGAGQGPSRRRDRLQQSRVCFRTRANLPRPSRSIGGRSRSTKRRSAKTIPTLRPGTTILPVCFRTRASLPRPSRSIGGRWRSVRRRWARTIPPSRPGTTISPYCFGPRASLPRPSRSIGGRWRSVRRRWARTIPPSRSGTTISPYCFGPGQACRGRAALSAGDRDRREGAGQRPSRRRNRLQQSRLIA